MRFEKAERRGEDDRIPGAGPQIGWCQPGHGEQPARARRLFKRPYQCPEREGRGILICFLGARIAYQRSEWKRNR